MRVDSRVSYRFDRTCKAFSTKNIHLATIILYQTIPTNVIANAAEQKHINIGLTQFIAFVVVVVVAILVFILFSFFISLIRKPMWMVNVVGP